MRLPDGKIIVLLCFSFSASCGAGRMQQSSEGEGYIYPVKGSKNTVKKAKNTATNPWVSKTPPPDFSSLQKTENKNFFVAFVDKKGQIHINDTVITEQEFLAAAKNALEAMPDVTAILLIESGFIQGIHLSAELSDIGYKNVQIYYPTATNR